MNITVDIDSVFQKVKEQTEKDLTEALTTTAKEVVASDYELGCYIRDYTRKWIHNNLKDIVMKELESLDIKTKVNKAVEKSVLDIVHNHLKNIKLE